MILSDLILSSALAQLDCVLAQRDAAWALWRIECDRGTSETLSRVYRVATDLDAMVARLSIPLLPSLMQIARAHITVSVGDPNAVP